MLVRVKGNVIFQKTNTVNVTDLKKTGLECGAKRDFVPKLGYPSGRISETFGRYFSLIATKVHVTRSNDSFILLSGIVLKSKYAGPTLTTS